MQDSTRADLCIDGVEEDFEVLDLPANRKRCVGEAKTGAKVREQEEEDEERRETEERERFGETGEKAKRQKERKKEK